MTGAIAHQRGRECDAMVCEPASDRGFVLASTLLFAASVWATVAWCSSMSSMDGMPMPGGWTMSMTWMRRQGHTWPGAAASFVAMWVVMTVAMMLPSLVPTLCRYRRAVRSTREPRLGPLTAALGVGYLLVSAVCGGVVFSTGAAEAAAAMAHPAVARAVPVTTGVAVLLAGTLQFTTWKARQLVCCREIFGRSRTPVHVLTAWHDGLVLGLHCSCCSAGPTAILLAIGVMNPGAMALVGTAVTAERLAAGDWIARAIGGA